MLPHTTLASRIAIGEAPNVHSVVAVALFPHGSYSCTLQLADVFGPRPVHSSTAVLIALSVTRIEGPPRDTTPSGRASLNDRTGGAIGLSMTKHRANPLQRRSTGFLHDLPSGGEGGHMLFLRNLC